MSREVGHHHAWPASWLEATLDAMVLLTTIGVVQCLLLLAQIFMVVRCWRAFKAIRDLEEIRDSLVSINQHLSVQAARSLREGDAFR
jgi:uncharacterized membrane protein YcjF (UPF0283 family)